MEYHIIISSEQIDLIEQNFTGIDDESDLLLEMFKNLEEDCINDLTK